MQITVAHEVWDNNSICWMFMVSLFTWLNFLLIFLWKTINTWFLCLCFGNTLLKLWKLLLCLAILALPRVAVKIVFVYIHGEERVVNCVWGFFALNKCHHQHHYVVQKFLLWNILTHVVQSRLALSWLFSWTSFDVSFLVNFRRFLSYGNTGNWTVYIDSVIHRVGLCLLC